MTRLGNASTAEINAAFDAIYPHLLALIRMYVPSFFQGQVMQQLQTPQTRRMMVQIIDEGLDAAEKVRDAHPAASTEKK